MSEAVLSLDHVNVSFPIYQTGSRSLKKNLISLGSAGRIARDAKDHVTVDALRDISLKIETGDRVAIVGANGAGKTTLLRVMAGIYEPISGAVTVKGRISPMFDIGLGMDMDLSGYDNIRLRGLLLGLRASQIEKMMSGIAEFTELGDYLEMPVRTYSSGMILRLTFSVATSFQPEILLMDEWILAGDGRFLTKAEARINSLIDNASILVLASHNLKVCRKWCNKALWLKNGEVHGFGPSADVIDAFEATM